VPPTPDEEKELIPKLAEELCRQDLAKAGPSPTP
jgi:hypothetical protein